jgi:hypothetical protein
LSLSGSVPLVSTSAGGMRSVCGGCASARFPAFKAWRCLRQYLH